MTDTEQENQLVDRILNGESDRYKILVDRYAPMVFSVVNEFVNSHEEAEELAQAIFVKTYERLSSFKGESKFSSWLYMIAKNHCRDYAKNIRRQNQNFSAMSENDLEAKLQDDPSAETDIERKEWVDLLKKGLEAISEKYSEAFLMKYQNDMTYKAMSKRLNISESALKVRVYRAKKELKEFMDKYK